MYRTRIDFHDRLQRGESPLAYVIIQTHMGYRAYADRELESIGSGSNLIADGFVLADGSQQAGAVLAGFLEKSARIVGMGAFERTIAPRTATLLAAYGRKQRQHLSLTLANADRHFSKLLPREPFLGRTVAAYIGFDDLPQQQHLQAFWGTISGVTVDGQNQTVTVEADER